MTLQSVGCARLPIKSSKTRLQRTAAIQIPGLPPAMPHAGGVSKAVEPGGVIHQNPLEVLVAR
ncbi:MAG: hypothetical protein QOJ04_6805 [Caballeronia sp.]|nr:hypothetical protein [Caballeronia sp.]